MASDVMLDLNFFIKVIEDMGKLTEENRNYWTKLDSDIGDGDHGINLSIGFRAIKKYMDETDLSNTDIKGFLKKVGMTLLGKVGGASGPLYGTLFMKMASPLTEETEVTSEQLAEMIIQGIEGIESRGKATVGEKTMVDALEPGKQVLAENKATITTETLNEFEVKMQEGAESTIPMVAKKGRALRLGDRAIGYKDPGAESSQMLLKVLADHLSQKIS
ncbi:dihydroxyacetone kinase subunit L [Tetragenococcus halophilus]|uniref:phosphoenolpyruvate--glycerone phosphotransferase n=3 Tax=Tetragenococcus halophilus TaxID=51669 RepID=A0A2H6CQM9_TETHA|nr:dihydroxyacetone kinase subunit DhaL [Tetragenococcus halophilus]MDN6270316.1 dihydroxyacetone kinase subunit L [Tetragenococcus koreensis]AOF48396.1 dihydroxyacetone kinase [Tetragenococcus halophilus]AYW49852.1 dihydroxyacetone kinase subunit L [Tetragenococcus halophilus]MCF1601424.1 dihydroxyacetone kinase subunit L [Tetragenococcus halophilus]MCO8287754.1 dihydroxyacetone kinase subunit L [Tetragenococcus halophilus]